MRFIAVFPTEVEAAESPKTIFGTNWRLQLVMMRRFWPGINAHIFYVCTDGANNELVSIGNDVWITIVSKWWRAFLAKKKEFWHHFGAFKTNMRLPTTKIQVSKLLVGPKSRLFLEEQLMATFLSCCKKNLKMSLNFFQKIDTIEAADGWMRSQGAHIELCTF